MIIFSFKVNKIISNNEYRGWRTTAGLEWKLSKSFDLKTFARIDRELNVKEPSRIMIYGVGLDYSAKFNKKKKEYSSL